MRDLRSAIRANLGRAARALVILVSVGVATVRVPSGEPVGQGGPIAVLGMRRGVNLGNALEAPREGAWGVVLREEYFRLIQEAGFDTVRIPIRWSGHAATDPPYTISDRMLARVDWAIGHALANDLITVINVHHYDELIADPTGHRDRFLALWDQIAARYADRPPTLLFELLNEPHGPMTAPIWNDLLVEALRVVRRTNPTRWVVVGPVDWNHVRAFPTLELPPDDRYIIGTFHYYEPFRFTHQGASWVSGSRPWLGTRWEGREEEKRAIERDLDLALKWATETGRPLYLGEFGAYSRADLASRVRWTEFVARQAEERGIPWSYWEFAAGFGIYDPRRREWRQGLLEALIPPQE